MSQNQMGITACMAYIVGCIIGSGIFITPTYVLQDTRSVFVSLLIWITSGCISLIGGVAYIELATGIPSDGGDYAYQKHAGWRVPSFCFMLTTAIFTYPGSTSVQAVTFGDYMVQGFEPFVPTIQPGIRIFLQHSIAIALLVGCTFLNFMSISQFASRFQVVVTIAKVAVLSVIVIVGGYVLFFGNNLIHQPIAEQKTGIGNYVMATYSGLWAFAGWDILNYGIPSVKNPRRTLPIALIGGLILVTIIYILVNGAFYVVLGPQGVLNSKAIAADFAQATLGPFSVFVPFATAIMLLGTVNAEIFVSSRIIFEAARRGDLPPFAAAIHKNTGSYRAALLISMCVSIIMTFINVETLINYVSFVMWGQKLITVLALLYIKFKDLPMDDEVLRIPSAVAITFLIFLIGLVFIPFVTKFTTTIVGIGFVTSGVIFYMIFIYPDTLPGFFKTINDWMSNITCRVLSSKIHLAIDDQDETPQEEALNEEKEALKEENGSLKKESLPN